MIASHKRLLVTLKEMYPDSPLLLDATIECLVSLGYARTTVQEICARAGVSRGAQAARCASS